MNFDNFNKWKGFGHMSSKAKSVIIVGGGLIVGSILYTAFMKDVNTEKNRDITQNLNDKTDISEKAIKKIRNRVGGLWFKNFIWIKGVQYELFSDGDGIKVKKNGRLVNIADVVGKDGAIINKDGRMYYYTNEGRLLDLESGDVVSDDGVLYQVKDDDKIGKFESNDLYFDDGTLKNVDGNGSGEIVGDDDVVTVDGVPMRMESGILRPLNNFTSKLGEGAYVATTNSKGELTFSRKSGNRLKDISRSEIPNGASVLVDGMPMTMIDSDLISKEEEKTGVLTADDIFKPIDGDYIVEMGADGEPLYYKIIDGKKIPVLASEIPASALVFYKGKAYIKGADGKLIPFKAKIGKPFIKGGKVFVIDSNGLPLLLDVGEVVDYNSDKFLVSKNNHLLSLSKKMEDELSKYPNRLMVVNGNKMLVGEKGVISNIKPTNIIFRAGVPYKEIDGRLVRLSNQEIKILSEKGKSINNAKRAEDNPVSTKTNYSPDYEQPTNDYDWDLFSATNSSIKSGMQLPNVKKGGDASKLSELEQKKRDVLNKFLENSDTSIQSTYQQQNNQQGKKDYLKSQKNNKTAGDVKNPDSPYSLLVGSVIDGTMITGISSDLPGNIAAVVNTNVYDSLTHNNLLIPSGTKLFGSYSSDVSYGQKRVVMVWNKLILPNGQIIELAGQQGYDLSGMSGLKGEVDNHYTELFKNVAMMSLFGAGAQYGAGLAGGGSIDGIQMIAASIGQQIGETGIELIQRTMNIQPSIEIYPGQKFKILIDTTFVFQSAYHFKNPLYFKR